MYQDNRENLLQLIKAGHEEAQDYFNKKAIAILKQGKSYNSKDRPKTFDEFVADVLIKNGIGDIAEWKSRAEFAERALKLAIKEIKFCPHPPEAVYNPDSECEEQVSNCDFADNIAECEECVMRYFLGKAEKQTVGRSEKNGQ